MEGSAFAARANEADWNGFTFGVPLLTPVNVTPSNERKQLSKSTYKEQRKGGVV